MIINTICFDLLSDFSLKIYCDGPIKFREEASILAL